LFTTSLAVPIVTWLFRFLVWTVWPSSPPTNPHSFGVEGGQARVHVTHTWTQTHTHTHAHTHTRTFTHTHRGVLTHRSGTCIPVIRIVRRVHICSWCRTLSFFCGWDFLVFRRVETQALKRIYRLDWILTFVAAGKGSKGPTEEVGLNAVLDIIADALCSLFMHHLRQALWHAWLRRFTLWPGTRQQWGGKVVHSIVGSQFFILGCIVFELWYSWHCF